MKTNLWALDKDRPLRRLLVSLDEMVGDVCDVVPDDGRDRRIVTLSHNELSCLRAHVYLHGQRPGTYGIFYEYPHPLPGMIETEENLPLLRALSSLILHFDA